MGYSDSNFQIGQALHKEYEQTYSATVEIVVAANPNIPMTQIFEGNEIQFTFQGGMYYPYSVFNATPAQVQTDADNFCKGKVNNPNSVAVNQQLAAAPGFIITFARASAVNQCSLPPHTNIGYANGHCLYLGFNSGFVNGVFGTRFASVECQL